jgi:uncharacterized OB-fold protein
MTEAIQHGFIDVPADADSAWWWEAVQEERLLLPRCEKCGRCFFPPQPTCPYCGSQSWAPIEATGRGTVYSWVVIHVALHPAFTTDVPYTILAVDLEEGSRILGRLVGQAEPRAGDRVNACFYEVEGRRLVGFRPES